ncbi:MAG: mechanosensitive ion channel [Bacteroidetes bacterium]|nr:mechanosensitive ion channel [Bacteroidota bacterium]
MQIYNYLSGKLLQYFGMGLSFYISNTILIILLTLIAGKIIKIILRRIGKQITRSTKTTIDDKIVETILSHDVSLSLIIGLYISLQAIIDTLSHRTAFYKTIDFIDKIVLSLLTIIIATAIVRGINLLTRQSLISTALRNKTTYDRAQTILIKRVVTIIASAISIIIILDLFGQNITSVLTILGIGSLAIGFASQDTIANIIAGYTIMIDRPFKIGDRIKLQSGEEGDVYEIGVRSTKILDFDNNLVVIPNAELVKTRIVNFIAPQEETRVVVDFTVQFDSDSHKVKDLLLNILRNETEFLSKPEPGVFLIKLSDIGLQFRVVGRVATVKSQAKVADRLRYQIYESMRLNNIKLATSQTK